jgi:hypothetical protein
MEMYGERRGGGISVHILNLSCRWPGETAPDIHFIGGFVGLRLNLGSVERGENLLPMLGVKLL